MRTAREKTPRRAGPLFRCILVPTDFTPCSLRALRYAARLVRGTGARLHLLHVVGAAAEGAPLAGCSELDSARDHLRSAAAGALRPDASGAEGAAGHGHVEHHIERAHKAAPVILSYAAALRADLVALGTHGRTGANRFLIGSTAERVVRHAQCSVLTVGPGGGLAPGLVRRLLVPVDFSAPARQAAAEAKRLAAHFGARLALLHVIEPALRPVFCGDHPGVFAFSATRPEAQARQELARFYKQAGGVQGPVAHHVMRGRPAPVIARFARENAVHLIVQGARGLTRLEDVPLLGGVAERVVRAAPCPVLTVRSVPEAADAAQPSAVCDARAADAPGP